MTLLRVEDLRVHFAAAGGEVEAVRGLSFELAAGAALGIAGESGCGKSLSALALMGLLPPGARASGAVQLERRQLLTLPESAWQDLRGARMAMVFQDPMSALHPQLRIGTQMAEGLRRHRGLDAAAAQAQCRRLLEAVQLPEAARRLRQYPHELSGGQRQRVMIAMALSCRPQLLIADEPTTALDATVQAQILKLLQELRREFGLALLLISHDLGVLAELCEDILVMYAGAAVERGPAAALLGRPAHPYTAALLACRPQLSGPLPAQLPALPGLPPRPGEAGGGCAFAPRCPRVQTQCHQVPPPGTGAGSSAACHYPLV